MPKLRVLGSVMLAASITIGAAGVASATDLVVGHGIPGATVDVCAATGGNLIELKSDFKYGQKFRVQGLAPGRYFITVRAARGECDGAKLIKIGPVAFTGVEDLTVIATKNSGLPGALIFDNSAGYDSSSAPVLSVKHGAMLGKADVWVSTVLNSKLASTEPTVSDVPKGTNANFLFAESDTRVSVGKAGTGVIAAETPFWAMKRAKINHFIPIGPPDKLRILRFRTDNKGIEE